MNRKGKLKLVASLCLAFASSVGFASTEAFLANLASALVLIQQQGPTIYTNNNAGVAQLTVKTSLLNKKSLAPLGHLCVNFASGDNYFSTKDDQGVVTTYCAAAGLLEGVIRSGDLTSGYSFTSTDVIDWTSMCNSRGGVATAINDGSDAAPRILQCVLGGDVQ